MGNSLDICVVTQQLGSVVSGIGLHARNLVSHLLADGHHVTVIAPVNQRPPGDLPYRFAAVPRPLLSGSQARWISLSFSFARALKALERQEHFDLVHFTDAREALLCGITAPVVGNINDTYSAELKPLGYYRRYYDDWAFRWSYYHFVHACESYLLPRLSAVLANSRYTASVIAVQYEVRPERLHVVHKSIEPEQYRPALELRQGHAPHPPRVLFVGGNMQRKGLPALIQAAPQVVEQFPEAEFWVAGQDKAAGRMQDLCRANRVDKAFHFLGLQSQESLLELYASSQVFAMPSLTEAFGVVYLEAMAAGVPVIGSNAGGIPEIIRDGQNGLLVPPDHPQELAQALIRLLGDAPLQARLSAAGLETARRFNAAQMMVETYRVYKEVCSK